MDVYSAKNPCRNKTEKEFLSKLKEYVNTHKGYIDTSDYISFAGQVQILVSIDEDDYERVMLLWMLKADIVCINLYEDMYDEGYKERAFSFLDGFFEGGISREKVPFDEIMNEIKKMKNH